MWLRNKNEHKVLVHSIQRVDLAERRLIKCRNLFETQTSFLSTLQYFFYRVEIFF